MFEIIKRYFEKGLYKEADLDVFVAAGQITATERDELLELLRGE